MGLYINLSQNKVENFDMHGKFWSTIWFAAFPLDSAKKKHRYNHLSGGRAKL